MAHGRAEAFDINDLRVMQALANFAATALRQLKLRADALDNARATAAASMANDLAHQINNPLQCLTNVVYLACTDPENSRVREFSQKLSNDLVRLTDLVGKLLALPVAAARAR
jgi:nitrogen-specific signal transduction histidine kinase